MALVLVVNGEERLLGALDGSASLAAVVRQLGLKGDRIAVEHNGTLVRRAAWDGVMVCDRDRLEVVHFVGGGAG